MIPLPLHMARCHPTAPDIHCKQCRRYADQPDQTWTGVPGGKPSVWHMNCLGSESPECRFIPIIEDGTS
jgi:hypothetical protein